MKLLMNLREFSVPREKELKGKPQALKPSKTQKLLNHAKGGNIDPRLGEIPLTHTSIRFPFDAHMLNSSTQLLPSGGHCSPLAWHLKQRLEKYSPSASRTVM